MKKALAVFFSVIMALSCFCVFASAESTAIEVALNTENSITIKSDETKTFSLSLNGTYTFITTGSKNVELKTVVTTGKSETRTPLDKAENGNIFHTDYFGLILTEKTYNFELSTNDGKPAVIKLWVINYSSQYSGFTHLPTTTATYREDVDFTVSGTAVTFKNGPDFSGAVFSFNDSSNNPIFTLSDSDVLNVLGTPIFTYSAGTIIYTSIASLNSNNTITFKATPNYLKSATISGVSNTSFTFGQNGTIKGNLSSYYYRPNIDFTGATVTVTYKDYVGGGSEELTVQSDASGYYVNCSFGGKQYITNEAKITSNSSTTYNAPVYIGNCQATLPLSITKASFFNFIGIWFGLLFGKYK